MQSENYPKYTNKILSGYIFSEINLDKIEIKEFITLHEQYLYKKRTYCLESHCGSCNN